MKKSILIGLSVVTCLTICVVVIYAQISSSPSIPQVEINARFSNADKNGDGVLSKEEFADYFAKIQQMKSAAKGTVKICPETGLPCEHEDADKTAAKTAGSEKSCCSEGKNAETVQVKLSQESEVKGGCCGGKDKAKTADAKTADSKKSCCSEGKNAETVQVKLSQEGEVKGGCCGGKDKAKTVDAQTADGKKSCCSEGKNAETVQVKLSQESEVKGGCCGGKDKAKTADVKTADTKNANGEKGCCGGKAKKANNDATNSDAELTVTKLENPVTVEKAEADTSTPEVRETDSNDKQ
ncbi:MAG: hypothetical protein LBE12_14285 [Planctomycetaceae bacterium]|nr:hypothetical protein [Planctomycetaceae bacterium]